MTQRTLELCVAIALASAVLACTPSAPAPEAEAAGETSAAAAPADEPSRSETEAARREERRASSARPSAATHYTWVDESGKLQLAARLEDVPERQRATAKPLEDPGARAGVDLSTDERGVVQNADVTIYTTSYCGYCRAAMAHFDQIGLDYVNRDVEQDEEARADYLELTGGRRGVPVIVVGNAWMQGWSRPEFERLMASAQ